MPTLELTVDQVIELVKQLPERDRFAVLHQLRVEQETFRRRIREQGQQQLRKQCAERGLDWDRMNDDERLAFVDDLLHED